jgi:predicted ATPase
MVTWALTRASSSAAAHAGSVASRLAGLVAAGAVEADEGQVAAAEELDKLLQRCRKHAQARGPGEPPQAPGPSRVPKGLYLWGGVGAGKTMLMDMAFDAARGGRPPLPVRRVHFHAFMLDMHARVHAAKAARRPSTSRTVSVPLPERDAITAVAVQLSRETQLLCLDELQVTDVADAFLVARLLSTLLSNGVVLVATSNRQVADLYSGDETGREHIAPFLARLGGHMKELQLPPVGKDYRVRAQGEAAPPGRVWGQCVHPLGARADAALAATLQALGARGYSEGVPSLAVPVAMGRTLSVRSPSPGVALASFDELCGLPLGAADYAALARSFPSLILTDVPLQSRARHNEARRLVTLLDELYEARVEVVLTAEAPPAELFQALTGGGTTGEDDFFQSRYDQVGLSLTARAVDASLGDLALASRRAASRLTEMTSPGYGELPATLEARRRRREE